MKNALLSPSILQVPLVSGGKLQIGEAGKFNVGDTDLGPHEYLHINPINIEKEGYIYIYLSNQTPGSEVYFDDLLITHTQSRIVQKNDYYPFGLSISALSSSRENTLTKKYLYNGKELQNELGLDWYDYGARFYDAAASRFFNIDPLSEYYYKHSPFNYAANNPIRYIDIYGLGPWDRIYFSMSLWGTPYKQELTSNLRTGNTTEALAYSDCSEHICRILAYDGITEGVEWMNTSALQEFFEDDSKFKEIEINDLQPGDFVIWSGHTALFTGYNDGKSRLYLSHSQNWLNTTTGKMETGTYENSWRKGYFKTKKAKFYRPKKENPDRHVFLGRKMDELLIEGKQTNRPRPISPQFKELQIMNQKNLDRYLHPNRLYKGDEGYNNSYWDLYDTLKEWGNEKKK